MSNKGDLTDLICLTQSSCETLSPAVPLHSVLAGSSSESVGTLHSSRTLDGNQAGVNEPPPVSSSAVTTWQDRSKEELELYSRSPCGVSINSGFNTWWLKLATAVASEPCYEDRADITQRCTKMKRQLDITSAVAENQCCSERDVCLRKKTVLWRWEFSLLVKDVLL